MKKNELDYNKEEHVALKKYAELRRKEREITLGGDRSMEIELGVIKSDIIKTANKLRELKKAFGTIADNLEQQIDIITFIF